MPQVPRSRYHTKFITSKYYSVYTMNHMRLQKVDFFVYLSISTLPILKFIYSTVVHVHVHSLQILLVYSDIIRTTGTCSIILKVKELLYRL